MISEISGKKQPTVTKDSNTNWQKNEGTATVAKMATFNQQQKSSNIQPVTKIKQHVTKAATINQQQPKTSTINQWQKCNNIKTKAATINWQQPQNKSGNNQLTAKKQHVMKVATINWQPKKATWDKGSNKSTGSDQNGNNQLEAKRSNSNIKSNHQLVLTK